MTNFPWHDTQWEQLQQCHQQQRFPHGLILHGPAGVGVNVFSRRLAQYLLCQNAHASDSAARACGQCAACKLFQAGTHPDLCELEVLEDKKNISIDQVRQMAQWQSIKSHLGGAQVVLIREAHKLSTSAANALLKTLEEPSGATVLILLTRNPGWLLPTVRSRCRTVKFSLPQRRQALDYLVNSTDKTEALELALDIAGGAPLTALAYLQGDYLVDRKEFFKEFQALCEDRESAIPIAGRWHKYDPEVIQHWLAAWCRDLIRLKVSGSMTLISNSDLVSELGRMAQHLGVRDLYKFLDQLTDMLKWVDRNLNIQLQLENLLLSWQQMIAESSTLKV